MCYAVFTGFRMIINYTVGVESVIKNDDSVRKESIRIEERVMQALGSVRIYKMIEISYSMIVLQFFMIIVLVIASVQLVETPRGAVRRFPRSGFNSA